MKCSVAAFEPGAIGAISIRLVAREDSRPESVTEAEFSADANATLLLREGERRELLVGIGPRAKATGDTLRQAAGSAIRHLQSIGHATASLDLRRYAAHVRRVTEGAIMGAYLFDSFLPDARKLKVRFVELILLVDKKLLATSKQDAATGTIWAQAANFTRSLGDLPGNYVVPATLAEAARDLARNNSALQVSVLDEEALRDGGFGGMMAVGSGSTHPPRLITIEYRGAKGAERPIALVGKAVTFDSGGISIKPAEKMEEMKFDKMGGCAVLGIMQAVARLKLKRNIVGVIPAAENLLDGASYRPGDVVTTYGGKTIEVLNTDAEGRVILADALAYAREKFKPTEIIDFATLTGACVVALGTCRAGLFCSDEKHAKRWVAAGNHTGERVWELPHDQPYHDQIKSDIALVKNTGGRWGGACTGAAFLETWAEDTPWTHLDIAGTAWTTENTPFLAKGATAFGVRLTLDYLERSV